MWGLVFGCVATVFYAVSTVLQAFASRRAARTGGAAPSFAALLRERTWWVALPVLAAAFGCFVLSTRGLPLPVAEVVRSGYIVLAALLGHLVFGTRPRRLELVGLVVGLGGLTAFAAMGGERGTDQAPSSLAWQMAILLVGSVVGSIVGDRLAGRRRVMGLVDAVLAGIAFATLDMAVRTLPASLAPSEIVRFGPTWLGVLAAPVGLWLFSRSTARESVAVATSLMVFVNTAGASAWAAAGLGDRVSANAAAVALAVAALVAGAMMVIFGSAGAVQQSAPTRLEPDPVKGPDLSPT
jgi:hypothetical protein